MKVGNESVDGTVHILWWIVCSLQAFDELDKAAEELRKLESRQITFSS